MSKAIDDVFTEIVCQVVIGFVREIVCDMSKVSMDVVSE